MFDRGQDFAAGIWVIDPLFTLDAVRQRADPDGAAVRAQAYFGGARLDDNDGAMPPNPTAAPRRRTRPPHGGDRQQPRPRHRRRAGRPHRDQLTALRETSAACSANTTRT